MAKNYLFMAIPFNCKNVCKNVLCVTWALGWSFIYSQGHLYSRNLINLITKSPLFTVQSQSWSIWEVVGSNPFFQCILIKNKHLFNNYSRQSCTKLNVIKIQTHNLLNWSKIYFSIPHNCHLFQKFCCLKKMNCIFTD